MKNAWLSRAYFYSVILEEHLITYLSKARTTSSPLSCLGKFPFALWPSRCKVTLNKLYSKGDLWLLLFRTVTITSFFLGGGLLSKCLIEIGKESRHENSSRVLSTALICVAETAMHYCKVIFHDYVTPDSCLNDFKAPKNCLENVPACL